MYEGLINLVHLLATAVWIGGSIFIKAVLEPSLKAIDPREEGKLMGALAPRFTIIAWSCIILLIVTGFLKTPSGMLLDTESSMGLTLAVKHLLIIGVIAVGLAIALVAVPRMRRAAPAPGAPPSEDFRKAGRLLQRLSMTSTILGIGILGAASFLW